MEEVGLDAFIATKSTAYFSGTTAGKMLIVPADHDPILLCSRLERERAETESWIKDIRAFSAWKSPLQRGERVYFMKLSELLHLSLKSLGARFIGHEELSPGVLRFLRQMNAAGYVEYSKLVQELRTIKDPLEIKLLKKSAKIANRGMRAAEEMLRPGVREIDVAAQAEYEMRRLGSQGTPFRTIVASGKNSSFPHAGATEKRIKRGELVIVDLGATYGGYASDCTRTFGFDLSERQKKIIEIVKRAQREAVTKTRSGVSARDICAAANRVIAKAGLLRYSLHGLGHGLGIEIHEPPSLHPESNDKLANGMVLTIEPGVYHPRIGGARWEDVFLIKKTGAEPLTMNT